MVGTDRRAVHPCGGLDSCAYYRVVFENLAKPNRRRRTTLSAGRRLRHHLLASRDFTPAY